MHAGRKYQGASREIHSFLPCTIQSCRVAHYRALHIAQGQALCFPERAAPCSKGTRATGKQSMEQESKALRTNNCPDLYDAIHFPLRR